MLETPDDLARLQDLLDESQARAGSHLRSIFDDEHRIDAAGLAAMLTGVRVLNLATVTAKGEPRVAPVDGLFFRGKWYFGSSEQSARFRHIRRNPAVSATYTEGEEVGVIVHGRAVEVDPWAPTESDLRALLVATYSGQQNQGEDWEDWARGCPYAFIDADRIFTRRWPA